MKITVLGAGNFGTCLAHHWSESGHQVTIWSVEKEVILEIQRKKTNRRYIRNLRLPKKLEATGDIEEAVKHAEAVVFAVPSGVVKSLVKDIIQIIPKGAFLINAGKGFDPETLDVMPVAMAAILPKKWARQIFQLSGPSFGKEIVQDIPTAVMLAGMKKHVAGLAKKLSTKSMQVLPSNDTVGVALGGSAKNCYVIALGICDASNYGMDAKAIIIERAIQETALLAEKMGGQRETIYGLAGLGDLVATGLGHGSRNRAFGEDLGRSRSAMSAHRKAHRTTEGIAAAEAIYRLSKRHKIKLPLAKAIFESVHLYKDARSTLDKYFKKAYN